MTCADCKFSSPQLDRDGKPIPKSPLLCRRYPPAPSPIFGPQLHPSAAPPHFGNISVWAMVQPTEWCGEFVASQPRLSLV